MKLSWTIERISAITFGALLLLVWDGVCRAGWVDPLILPAPGKVASTLFHGLLGTAQLSYPIASHTLSSLSLLAIGFPLGSLIGVAIGVAVGLNDYAYRMVGPVLGMLLPVPAIAWAPIALVWFGLGAPAIIAVVTYACFSEVVYNTASGVRSIPQRYGWVIQSFGASRWQHLTRVVLPAAFPQIFVGLKLGLAASWRSLIGAEMFAGASFGLGFMLYEAREFYATDIMFASLALVAIFSLLLEQVGLRYIERQTLERWGMSRTLKV